MPNFEQIHPFLISLVIGLIIGIERERSHPRGTQAAGVRTFTLFGLLGTLAAYIGKNYFTFGVTFFVAAIVLIGYWKTARGPAQDPGLTTEVSAVVVFAIGYLTPTNPFLALLLGVAVFTILFSRQWLHRFSRETLKPEEIQSALTLAVFLVGVLPFLPNRVVDPWGFINPLRLASVIAALAVIQFASYVVVRILGQRIGLMFAGFLGGLVSSTSVFATLPEKVKKYPNLNNLATASALLATLGMLMEFVIIVTMSAPELSRAIIVPSLSMCMAGLVIAYILGRKGKSNQIGEIGDAHNPLDIRSVLKLSAFIIGMLMTIAVAKRWLGNRALLITVFLGSFFELHGVTFSTANLFAVGQIKKDEAITLLVTAVSGAFVSKFGILWVLNRGRFAIATSLALLTILFLGGSIFWLIKNPISS